MVIKRGRALCFVRAGDSQHEGPGRGAGLLRHVTVPAGCTAPRDRGFLGRWFLGLRIVPAGAPPFSSVTPAGREGFFGSRCQRPVLEKSARRLSGSFRVRKRGSDPPASPATSCLTCREDLRCLSRSAPLSLEERPMRSEMCPFRRVPLIRRPLTCRSVGFGRTRLPRREKRLSNDGILGRVSFPLPASHDGPSFSAARFLKLLVLSEKKIFNCCEGTEGERQFATAARMETRNGERSGLDSSGQCCLQPIEAAGPALFVLGGLLCVGELFVD